MSSTIFDEGFADEGAVEHAPPPSPPALYQPWMDVLSDAQRQELALRLLASLPRTQLAEFHRNLAPKLKVDIVGRLPSLSSQICRTSLCSHAPLCPKVANSRKRPELWKRLCHARNWYWKTPRGDVIPAEPSHRIDLDVDEGVGEEEAEYSMDTSVIARPSSGFRTRVHDSGFVSMLSETSLVMPGLHHRPTSIQQIGLALSRFDKPGSLIHSRVLSTIVNSPAVLSPNYKLLHQTHTQLNSRMRTASFRMTVLPLPMRNPVPNIDIPQGHSSTIYCLALYTHPSSGHQYLLTGSRDCTILEWDLRVSRPVRCFRGAHFGSVLNLAVAGKWMITGGSDGQIVVWNLIDGSVHTTRQDTDDSVLCVRASAQTVVACGKDRHLRIYSLPDLRLTHTLVSHRAAVNALSLSPDGLFVISASGDRSVRIWDTIKGVVIASLEGWHSRGIASIDFHPPYIVSGSSDKHVRVFNLQTREGWSTCCDTTRSPLPELPENLPPSLTSGSNFIDHVPFQVTPSPVASGTICQSCNGAGTVGKQPVGHKDLVRTVSMNSEFVVSGSYDETIKVWDRQTGGLLADLTGGHTGRVFGVAFDSTKIVSCGEDQKICIWDLSFGLDTSFIKL
ncbi:F-box/WD repeat-containing protein pof11 [Ceratobasidium sp. AG-Ba]|nr:F-box/WD repeat-containing protein pof11 [Ceratobasidium sp. AG-Ba]